MDPIAEAAEAGIGYECFKEKNYQHVQMSQGARAKQKQESNIKEQLGLNREVTGRQPEELRMSCSLYILGRLITEQETDG